MPIYMDSHDINGVSSKDVAKAHQEDLKIQKNYGCKALTYWFDEERGSAFCLIDAPNKEAVEEMHNHAHGLIPNKIVEVEDTVVESFLGRIEDPIPEDNVDKNGLLIINDPAFRAILAIMLKQEYLLTHKFGKSQAAFIVKSYNSLIDNAVQNHDGRKIDNVKEGLLISFKSVKNAISCAQSIFQEQEKLKFKDYNYALKIGISAGVPITENEEFFGDTVKKARLLCDIFNGDKIMVSSSIKDYISEVELGDISNSKTKFIQNNEEIFLLKLSGILEQDWNNSSLSVETISEKIGISKSQIYRKMKSILGISLLDFLKAERMKRSIQLLAETKCTISEVAFDSGFNSASYFSKCFKDYFKFPPTDFIKQQIRY